MLRPYMGAGWIAPRTTADIPLAKFCETSIHARYLRRCGGLALFFYQNVRNCRELSAAVGRQIVETNKNARALRIGSDYESAARICQGTRFRKLASPSRRRKYAKWCQELIIGDERKNG